MANLNKQILTATSLYLVLFFFNACKDKSTPPSETEFTFTTTDSLVFEYCDTLPIIVTPSCALNKEFGVNENHLLINKTSSDVQYQRMIKTLSETVENFLKCRLHILGRISKEELPDDQFDRVLLNEENNSLHKNFVNIIKKFTDEIECNSISQAKRYEEHNEHDVRITV
jgi:hypothetical protein